MLAKKTKIDVGFVVKTFVCGVAFVLAMVYFSSLCGGIVSDYSVLFSASIGGLLGKLALAAVVFLLMTSLVAALVRPTWLAIIIYAVGALVYPFMLGFGLATLITAGVILGLMVLYLLLAVRQFDNQIKFSTHPLLGKKLLIGTLLAVLASVAVGLGYNVDSAAKNYVIPPVAKSFYVEKMTSIVKGSFDAQTADAKKMTAKQKKALDKQKQTALDDAVKGFNKTLDDAEKSLKPNQRYIGILLGVVAFIVLQIMFILVALVAVLLVPVLFWILQIARFTNTTTEKVEVVRLTLRSKE